MKGGKLKDKNASTSNANSLRVLQEEHRNVVTIHQGSSSAWSVDVPIRQPQSPQSIQPVRNLRRRRAADSSSPSTSATKSTRRKPMALQIPTPILEEPPDPLQHQQYLDDAHAQSAPPATGQHAGHVPQAPPRETPLPAQVFKHFKDVVEAQEQGDIEAASAAFKPINTKLSKLPRDSPEKAEIFAECALHLLLEARRCSAQHFANDAHTKAQRAKDCLQTAIKLQQTVSNLQDTRCTLSDSPASSQLDLVVQPHHYLWLGWTYEFLGKRADAHKAYEDGLSACADRTAPLAFELSMSHVELYFEDKDWGQCWETVMGMLKIWPHVADLYARVGLMAIRKDLETQPLEALQRGLVFYKAAHKLSPENPIYSACVDRIEEQLPPSLPSAIVSSTTTTLPGPGYQQPPSFLDMRSQGSSGSPFSDYGQVLPPSQRQFVGVSRPQSAAPALHEWPSAPVPVAPEPWQLPSPSLRSRSAVSSPGPGMGLPKTRRISNTHRARGLLHRVQEAVKSIHEVARAVTPLKDRVRETQEVLNHQYETLHGRVEDLNIKHETLERDVTRRLSQTESNLQEFQEEIKAHNEQMKNEFTAEAARRAQSVPPRLHETRMNNPANLSQDELLERSIMLYGVWALEKRLAAGAQ